MARAIERSLRQTNCVVRISNLLQEIATKPALAHYHCVGVRLAAVLADLSSGSDHSLKVMLEKRKQACVLAVRSNHHFEFIDQRSFVANNLSELVKGLAGEDWLVLVAGGGPRDRDSMVGPAL